MLQSSLADMVKQIELSQLQTLKKNLKPQIFSLDKESSVISSSEEHFMALQRWRCIYRKQYQQLGVDWFVTQPPFKSCIWK